MRMNLNPFSNQFKKNNKKKLDMVSDKLNIAILATVLVLIVTLIGVNDKVTKKEDIRERNILEIKNKEIERIKMRPKDFANYAALELARAAYILSIREVDLKKENIKKELIQNKLNELSKSPLAWRDAYSLSLKNSFYVYMSYDELGNIKVTEKLNDSGGLESYACVTTAGYGAGGCNSAMLSDDVNISLLNNRSLKNHIFLVVDDPGNTRELLQ